MSSSSNKLKLEIEPEIRAMAPDYLARRKQELLVIKNCLSTNKIDEVRQLAHQWKGHAASFGFPELGTIAARLEAAAAARDMVQSKALTDDLERSLDAAFRAILV